MPAGNKAEATEMFLHHDLSLLDALRDFDLLIAGQQRHLPHLLEIHPHWVIENIDFGGRSTLFFLFLIIGLFFAVPVAIHFGRLDDIDLQSAQTRENQVQFVGVSDSLRQRLVEIVEREITLFFREFDQLPNSGLNFSRRIQTKHAECRDRARPVVVRLD